MNPDISLAKAVEDVSKQGNAQTEALREKEKTLSSLQTTLSDVEVKAEKAEKELRTKMREILMLEGDMEHLEQQTKALLGRCVSISNECAQLQIQICDEEEKSCKARAGFDTYRTKMEGHRAAVLHAASQTDVHKKLMEKREQVVMLTQQKEELRKDLQDPNGNAVHIAKREVDGLKEEISAIRRATAERRERLQIEYETHTQLKRDIEIKNKRYKAIIKRLHCQLSRAQAAQRQMSEDIYHMERRLDELTKKQESN